MERAKRLVYFYNNSSLDVDAVGVLRKVKEGVYFLVGFEGPSFLSYHILKSARYSVNSYAYYVYRSVMKERRFLQCGAGHQ